MNDSAYYIPILNLILAFIPVVIVILIYARWSLDFKTVIYASLRMILQLIAIGYVLIFIFNQSNVWITSCVITIMILFASWIALYPVKQIRTKYYFKTLLSVFWGGIPVLILIVAGVIRLNPWFMPRYLIPLAGMIFANCMNSVSLCAERFYSERKEGKTYMDARNVSYRTSLLPLTNSFFAVGLVAIPGMMTGQILAGISPLLAARYQIMVMCMLFGARGISSAIFLYFMRKE